MQIFRRNRERDVRDIGGVVSQQASAAAEQAQRMMDEGVNQANRALSAAREQGAQLSEDAGEALGEWRSSVESAVRAQPITALALAALAGLAFGALFRTGDKS
ncbi:MAG: hypothetical protein ACR652_25180 [Methylocystis sp.]|uniref:hypothetical protein n=1 Tax=Methylocystis sp. TaxID=1911079 RepID=UPI003DA1E5CD